MLAQGHTTSKDRELIFDCKHRFYRLHTEKEAPAGLLTKILRAAVPNSNTHRGWAGNMTE